MNAFVRQMLVTATGAALICVMGAPAGAQSQSPSTNNANPAQHTIQMVPVLASLDHTLDAKKAKQGEAVTAKLQKDVQLSQQALPKNTVLEGHVDQVQSSDHRSDSSLVVTFDKAKLKSGKELPIKATVLQIAEPAYMRQQPTGEAAGGGMPAGGAPVGGGGAMPGGAPGGASPSGTAPSTPQAQPEPMAPQPSNTQQRAQRNGVPGVMLQSDIHQQASATFTSKGRNVHLPDGTQMEVAVAVIPAGVHIQ